VDDCGAQQLLKVKVEQPANAVPVTVVRLLRCLLQRYMHSPADLCFALYVVWNLTWQSPVTADQFSKSRLFARTLVQVIGVHAINDPQRQVIRLVLPVFYQLSWKTIQKHLHPLLHAPFGGPVEPTGSNKVAAALADAAGTAATGVEAAGGGGGGAAAAAAAATVAVSTPAVASQMEVARVIVECTMRFLQPQQHWKQNDSRAVQHAIKTLCTLNSETAQSMQPTLFPANQPWFTLQAFLRESGTTDASQICNDLDTWLIPFASVFQRQIQVTPQPRAVFASPQASTMLASPATAASHIAATDAAGSGAPLHVASLSLMPMPPMMTVAN
jgi:hypothetical protein